MEHTHSIGLDGLLNNKTDGMHNYRSIVEVKTAISPLYFTQLKWEALFSCRCFSQAQGMQNRNLSPMPSHPGKRRGETYVLLGQD